MPSGVYKRNKEEWRRKRLGVKVHTEESKRKIGLAHKGNQYSFTGDKVGYHGLHSWIRRKLGTPSKCEHCGTETAKKFEWANKEHTYKRDFNDWIRLCSHCHRMYDKSKGFGRKY